MDKQLVELLHFIEGKVFPMFGKGITTYPGRDADQQKLHVGVLELEKLGKVRRHLEKETYIVWMPVEVVNENNNDTYGGCHLR